MGNSAYVVFEGKDKHRSPAIYLHWNGSAESIYPFLDALQRYNARGALDPSYAAARFTQIVSNYFGGTLSIGLENTPESIDELAGVGDNGLYVVTPTIIRRCVMEYYDAERVGNTRRPRWFTEEEVERERRDAYKHRYSVPEKPGDSTISDEIDRLNAAHFKESYALEKEGKHVAVIVRRDPSIALPGASPAAE